ncbi:MAG TPA: hypothetical protein VMW24_03920 [Sedimentisphaerales bacterium]|nr:hypothetical protein [Sedimentisphaerales bacterium]
MALVRIHQHLTDGAKTFAYWKPGQTNPHGYPINQQQDVLSTVLTPEEFGGVYNIENPTQTQLEANMAALQLCLDRTFDIGGVIEISDYYQIWGTLNIPLRQYPASPGYDASVPMEIRGRGPHSTLMQYQPGVPAIYINSTYSPQIGHTSATKHIHDLAICSKGKGIVTQSGGKEIKIERVIVYGCADTAVEINEFDGGILGPINCIRNEADGFVMDNSHNVKLEITSRINQDRGVVFTGACNGIDGWIYTEANGGTGIDADGLTQSQLIMWMEANEGELGQGTFQGKLRNCRDIRFYGNDGWERNVAYDCDGISSLTKHHDHQAIPDARLAPYRLNVAWPPGQAMSGPYKGTAPYPTKAEVGQTVEITVPTSWHIDPSAGSGWMELYNVGLYPTIFTALNGISFADGESLFVRIKLHVDANTSSWIRSRLLTKEADVPCKFALANMTGKMTEPRQLLWMPDSSSMVVDLHASRITGAASSPRLFMYLPAATETAEPPTEHKWIIDDIGWFKVTR